MKKFLNSTVGFVLIYLCLMIPTYILPYFGSNSVIANGVGAAIDVETGGRSSLFTHFPFLLHLAFLLGLCYISFIRGDIISKKWLVVLPIIAVIFDLTPILSEIPFIPSILHILTIILGAIGVNKATNNGWQDYNNHRDYDNRQSYNGRQNNNDHHRDYGDRQSYNSRQYNNVRQDYNDHQSYNRSIVKGYPMDTKMISLAIVVILLCFIGGIGAAMLYNQYEEKQQIEEARYQVQQFHKANANAFNQL